MKIKKHITILIVMVIIFLFCPITTISADDSIIGSTVTDIMFTPGTLTLTEMSSFTFGSYTISYDLKDYSAKESKIFLDVLDLRGTGAGWKITALASEFNPGENPTLPGASISFINGTANTSSAGVAPDVVKNIRLDCDGRSSTKIVSAEVNSGLGGWSIEWNGIAQNNNSVILTLPAGAATVGSHTANITWTLTNGP